MIYTKKLRLVISAALLFVFFAGAQAHAAGKKTQIRFENKTGSEVDISESNWSGSYWPQFLHDPIPTDTFSIGKIKSLVNIGNTILHFNVKIHDPDDVNYGKVCYYIVEMSNATEQLSLVYAIGFEGAVCTITEQQSNANSDNEVTFEMS